MKVYSTSCRYYSPFIWYLMRHSGQGLCSRMALTSSSNYSDSVFKMHSKTRDACCFRFDIVCSSVQSGAMLMAWMMSSSGYWRCIRTFTYLIIWFISDCDKKASARTNLTVMSYVSPLLISSSSSLTSSFLTYLELTVSIMMIRLTHCSGLM